MVANGVTVKDGVRVGTPVGVRVMEAVGVGVPVQ